MARVFYVAHLRVDSNRRERYVTLAGRLWGWTYDIKAALQFSRAADAEAIVKAFLPVEAVVVPHEERSEDDPPDEWPTPKPDEFQEFEHLEYDG